MAQAVKVKEFHQQTIVTWYTRLLMHLDSWFTKVSDSGWYNNTDLNAKGFAMYPGKFSLVCNVVGTTILTSMLCTIILIGMRVLHKLWPTFLS